MKARKGKYLQEIPKFIRYSKSQYKEYFYQILIKKLLYKHDLLTSIKLVSNRIYKANIKRFIARTLRFFEHNYTEEYVYNEVLKQYKYKPKKYNFKVFTLTPEIKEQIKKYTQEQIKKTNQEKYGVNYPFQLKEVQDKVKATNLENLGVENRFYLKEFQDSVKEYNLEKYGVECVFSAKQFKNKVKQYNLEKYGVESAAQLHVLNYEHYNDINFIREKFIEDGCFLIYDFCEYFNIGYVSGFNRKRKLKIKEPNKIYKHKIQNFIYNNINIENKILNDRSFIKPLEIDILLPDNRLAIEYNGLLWHSRGLSDYHFLNDLSADTKFKHLKKTELVESKGFKLFHIFESDNLDIWLSIINNHLGLNKKIYARKTEIRSLKYSEVKDFLEQNHLQGSCTSSINYGLFYEQELVEVMTFGKSRFNRSYSYELLRLCSKKYTNVVGGASKLFARFLKDYPTGNIISYANRRFSNGKIYEKLGFNFIRKSEPNYFYFIPNIFELYSRNKFQKHKLKEFDNYSSDKSESQIMFENGFRQIFDSGNLVYEYKRD